MNATMMRSSSRASGIASSSKRSKTLLSRPAPFGKASSGSSRTSSVKVYAKKGQKGRSGVVPGQGELVRNEPPVPDVDDENTEFVVFVRATNYMDDKMKVMMKASPWAPLTIVKGGQAANFLAKAIENKWGRALYQKTLIKQIGLACYKDRDQIERSMKQQQPNLKTVPAANFQYAFKIRDKTVPKDWYKAENITIFPPENMISGTALDDLKAFFSPDSFQKMFATS